MFVTTKNRSGYTTFNLYLKLFALFYGRNSLTNTTYDEMLRAKRLVIAGRLGHLKRTIDTHGLQKNPFCKLYYDWLINQCLNGGVLFKNDSSN